MPKRIRKLPEEIVTYDVTIKLRATGKSTSEALACAAIELGRTDPQEWPAEVEFAEESPDRA